MANDSQSSDYESVDMNKLSRIKAIKYCTKKLSEQIQQGPVEHDTFAFDGLGYDDCVQLGQLLTIFMLKVNQQLDNHSSNRSSMVERSSRKSGYNDTHGRDSRRLYRKRMNTSWERRSLKLIDDGELFMHLEYSGSVRRGHINFKIVDEYGRFVYCRMKKNMRFRKTMRIYADSTYVEVHSMIFSYCGERVGVTHTPQQMEMQSGDTIEVNRRVPYFSFPEPVISLI